MKESGAVYWSGFLLFIFYVCKMSTECAENNMLWNENCLSLPSSEWKLFYCSRSIDLEKPKYPYKDKSMRHFVRESYKGRQIGVFKLCFLLLVKIFLQ